MDRNRWIIFIVLCVGILGGLIFLNKRDKVDVESVDASKPIAQTESALGDHVYGNKNAKVVLIEYGDFQCPGCAGAFPQLKKIKEQYKDQIAFVFRNFPLTSIHPNALAASTAAEAAGLQGKFWEMHDKLYEQQDSWKALDTSKRVEAFSDYASQIGLDVDKFRTDLSSGMVSAKISRDRSLGAKLNISGTPSIFIGNTQVTSEVSSDVIQGSGAKLISEINKALKAAGVEAPAQQ